MDRMEEPQKSTLKWEVETSWSGNQTETIRTIWRDDPVRSPFSSPSYLETMARLALRRGEKPLVAKGFLRDGRVVAVWPLRLDRHRCIRFLQKAYCDQANCIKKTGISAHAAAEGIEAVFRRFTPRAVIFQNASSFNDTRSSILLGLHQCGWHTRIPSSGICPIALYRPPPGHAQAPIFAQPKKIRYQVRRIQKQEGFSFHVKVPRNPDEIQSWIEAFFEMHIRRWQKTSTPSQYRISSQREIFALVLDAWLRDGLLILATLHLGQKPAVMNVYLRAGTRIIFIHHAHDRTVSGKWSTGIVANVMFAQWMIQQGYVALDFGLGDESYKGRLTNAHETVWKIVGSPSRCSPYFLAAALEKRIRRSPRAMQLIRHGKSLVSRRLLSGPRQNNTE